MTETARPPLHERETPDPSRAQRRNGTFFKGGAADPRQVTLLPDPPMAARQFVLISSDDHVVEPPHTFKGRVPARFAERAPKIVEWPTGAEVWDYDGTPQPYI